MTVETFIISLLPEELWLLHRFLRLPKDQGAREFSQDLMKQIYKGIVYNESHDKKNIEWKVNCDETDLWLITRYVDMDYLDSQSRMIGKHLLLKTMNILSGYYELSEEEALKITSDLIEESERMFKTLKEESKD